MKIRSAIYWTVIALTAVPFLVFSILIIQLFSAFLDTALRDSLYVVANAQISEMQEFCDNQRQIMSVIGNMDTTRSALKDHSNVRLSQYLDDMLFMHTKMTDYLRSVAILDDSFRVIACSDDHTVFADAKVGQLLNMSGDEFFISNIVSASDGKSKYKTLVSVLRLKDEDGLIGYVLAEINLDFYKRLREQAMLWTGSTFYLLDGNGKIISAGTSDEERSDFVTTEDERKDYRNKFNAIDLTKNPRGDFKYTVKGKNYITYYSPVEHTQWEVMLTVDSSRYEANGTAYMIMAGTIIALCGGLLIGIGKFSFKRIISPIKRISETLSVICNKQDYSLRVDVKNSDELGVLAGEINGLLSFIETENLYKIKQQRLLQQMAERDALTKALNKERITQYLHQAIERHQADGTMMAVLFVDIDDFKAFNTNYGHSVGDQVLLFVTAIISNEVGGTVGRFGGDEFLGIVEDAAAVMELDLRLGNLAEAAGSRFVMRGTRCHLEISCCVGGVRVDFSRCKDKTVTADELIGLADSAMYSAKNSGKKGYVIVDYPD